MSKEKIWDCSVITYNEEINELPNGADAPPRKAVIDAIESLGLSVHSISSGWGSEEFTPKIAKLNRRVAGLEGEIVIKEKRIAELEQIVLSVGHIGVDFGYGVYEIDQATIDKARQLTNKGGAE
jgi:23S rRNA G2445 N2-methylase RlmL